MTRFSSSSVVGGGGSGRRNARAEADAAATVVANAVNLDDTRIQRVPASSLRDDTDLGDVLDGTLPDAWPSLDGTADRAKDGAERSGAAWGDDIAERSAGDAAVQQVHSVHLFDDSATLNLHAFDSFPLDRSLGWTLGTQPARLEDDLDRWWAALVQDADAPAVDLLATLAVVLGPAS